MWRCPGAVAAGNTPRRDQRAPAAIEAHQTQSGDAGHSHVAVGFFAFFSGSDLTSPVAPPR